MSDSTKCEVIDMVDIRRAAFQFAKDHVGILPDKVSLSDTEFSVIINGLNILVQSVIDRATLQKGKAYLFPIDNETLLKIIEQRVEKALGN